MFFLDPDLVSIPQNQEFGFSITAGKTECKMRKAYWISTYQKVIDDTKLAAYAALACYFGWWWPVSGSRHTGKSL
jgi:hypothetical protein